MTVYYRPLARMDADRPPQALPLAGGWCWFDRVAVHRRGSAVEVCPADQVPQDVLDRLTRSRAPIAGLAMHTPQIMGILNVTPDSFSDGGAFVHVNEALIQALQMVEDGASIVDIGGESTRPGAAFVPEEEEIRRTAPVIKSIREQTDCAISIDTRKSAVAEVAMTAGATMINDVAAFTFDSTLASIAAEFNCPACLMHAQGDPETMQDDPQYDDVLLDVYDFLEARVAVAEAAGIDRAQIIVDPGIGFGKTVAHNLALLRGLTLFHGLGCPILLGASRKRFIGTLGGGETAQDRVGGSVAVALQGLRQGVQILRVHDTFETKQAFDLEWAMNGAAMA